jgi:hypothetical protein
VCEPFDFDLAIRPWLERIGRIRVLRYLQISTHCHLLPSEASKGRDRSVTYEAETKGCPSGT